MISSDYIRGYNDLMILSLLKQEDSYAYAISKLLNEISEDMYIIKETTLYSAFARLEKNEYIESYYIDEQSGGTKRRYYAITKNGLKFLEEKTKEWKITKQVVDNTINWSK